MKITDELIAKFLKDQCTDQEAEAAGQYLKEHPDFLETVLPKSEWNAILNAKPRTDNIKKKDSYKRLIIVLIAVLLLLMIFLMRLCNKPQKEVLLSMLPNGL